MFIKRNPAIVIFLCVAAIHSGILTSASSVLDNKSSYSPTNSTDGDYSTAWVEGSRSDGTNEWIRLDFGQEKHLSFLGVIPGYLKFSANGKDLWTANNQIKKATVEFSDSTFKQIVFRSVPVKFNSDSKEINDMAVKTITYFKIDKNTSFIKLKIDSVFRGTECNDACISEIIPIFDSIPSYHVGNADSNDAVLLRCLFYFSIPPFTISFIDKAQPVCGSEEGFFPAFQKYDDSTYYSDEYMLEVLPTAQFILSSPGADIVDVLQASEYRWSFGFDPSMWYKKDSLLLNDKIHITAWKKLKPKNNKYELSDLTLSEQSGKTEGTSKELKNFYIDYFDSLKTALHYDKYFNQSKPEECMAFIKFATHIKIIYKITSKTRTIHLILINRYGHC